MKFRSKAGVGEIFIQRLPIGQIGLASNQRIEEIQELRLDLDFQSWQLDKPPGLSQALDQANILEEDCIPGDMGKV